jgi:hypothetical protein
MLKDVGTQPPRNGIGRVSDLWVRQLFVLPSLLLLWTLLKPVGTQPPRNGIGRDSDLWVRQLFVFLLIPPAFEDDAEASEDTITQKWHRSRLRSPPPLHMRYEALSFNPPPQG